MKGMTQGEKLSLLLATLRELVQENRQRAKYETEHHMKAWLEGRAAAFSVASDLLGKVLA